MVPVTAAVGGDHLAGCPASQGLGASTDPDPVASPGQRPSSPFPQLHALSPSSSQLGAGVGKRFPIAEGRREVDKSPCHIRAPVASCLIDCIETDTTTAYLIDTSATSG